MDEVIREAPDKVFERHWQAQREREQARIDAWLAALPEACGIPKRFREYTLESYPARNQLWRAIDLWLTMENRMPGLFVTGPAGVGKTGLLTAVFRQLVEREMERSGWRKPELVGRWISEAHLIGALYREVAEHSAQTFDQVRSIRVLLLDDFGKVPTSDWAYSRMFAIIDERYANDLPTLITSNLPEDEIDRALMGRIHELCDVIRVPADATDLRRAS